MEVIEIGGETPPDPAKVDLARRPITRRWRLWLGALLVVAAAGFAIIRSHPAPAAPAVAPTAEVSVDGPSRPLPDPQAVAPASTNLGRPILGITASWELFGLSDVGVVRIDFAQGRLTQTPVSVDSTGPASLVAGSNWAMVRPLDNVPGYLVRDGAAAAPLRGPLSLGGLVEPGPDRRGVWLPDIDGSSVLTLVGLDGRSQGPTLTLPTGGSGYIGSDTTGYIVSPGVGGWYLARPDGLRRITTGGLLAVGPTRWLTDECDDVQHCRSVIVDRATGARHVLTRTLPIKSAEPPGVISPDGHTAAVVETTDGTDHIHLVNLTTEHDITTNATLGEVFDPSTVVWSPDSRWVFIAGGAGELFAVDARTGATVDPGLVVPPVRLLSLRSAVP